MGNRIVCVTLFGSVVETSRPWRLSVDLSLLLLGRAPHGSVRFTLC